MVWPCRPGTGCTCHALELSACRPLPRLFPRQCRYPGVSGSALSVRRGGKRGLEQAPVHQHALHASRACRHLWQRAFPSPSSPAACPQTPSLLLLGPSVPARSLPRQCPRIQLASQAHSCHCQQQPGSSRVSQRDGTGEDPRPMKAVARTCCFFRVSAHRDQLRLLRKYGMFDDTHTCACARRSSAMRHAHPCAFTHMRRAHSQAHA